MALASGTRFGSYEVAEAIGAGGMGEVYRATDTTLERDVALKVLPASFAEDADRVTRFEREAKTLAALNHPNIAQIYGLDKSDGTTALVMELVDGATLEERIAKGPIPADEALGVAMQIADALEAAHGQNIVHRDLKPANIKLKQDGTVKVLDFGIAKALAPELLTSEPQSPIMTTPATQVGVILGTAAYMSPEQAKGKAIDQRTDIWAFGCVLYEMLTGQLAFGAEDVPTTLARIIDRDTDLDSLPAAISPGVRQAIKLCLEKDVRERLADIRDVRLMLKGALDVDAEIGNVVAVVRPLWHRALPAAAAMLVGGIVVGLATWSGSPDTINADVVRFQAAPADLLSVGEFNRKALAISPDGRHFAYSARANLFVHSMEEGFARPISGTERSGRAFGRTSVPFFSPDGQWIAFYDRLSRQLKRAPISGGAPLEIASFAEIPLGADWTPDNMILYVLGDGIWRVAADGAAPPEHIIEADQDERFHSLQLLPDGDHVLTSVTSTGDWNDASLVIVSLSTRERRAIGLRGLEGRYLPTGHFVYSVGDGLFAAPFSIDQLELVGGPTPVLDAVMKAPANLTAAAHYAISEKGTLIYMPPVMPVPVRYTWFSRTGEPLDTIPEISATRGGFDLNSAETQLVDLRIVGGNTSVWVTDLQRGSSSILVSPDDVPGLDVRDPVWSTDGRQVAFMDAARERLLSVSASGGDPTVLLDVEGLGGLEDWSADDRILLVNIQGGIGAAVAIEGDEELVALDRPANAFDEPHFSPDGKWIAFNADRGGSGTEVYVVPYPPTGERFAISSGGGAQAQWRRDGRELFYLSLDGTLMSVDIDVSDGFSPGPPRALFDTGLEVSSNTDQYAVSGDGERFLLRAPVSDDSNFSRPAFNVVLNWFEELNRLVPTE